MEVCFCGISLFVRNGEVGGLFCGEVVGNGEVGVCFVG